MNRKSTRLIAVSHINIDATLPHFEESQVQIAIKYGATLSVPVLMVRLEHGTTKLRYDIVEGHQVVSNYIEAKRRAPQRCENMPAWVFHYDETSIDSLGTDIVPNENIYEFIGTQPIEDTQVIPTKRVMKARVKATPQASVIEEKKVLLVVSIKKRSDAVPFSEMTSRDEAYAALNGMTRSQLKEVAQRENVTVFDRGTVDEYRDRLVSALVGHRLVSRAIRGDNEVAISASPSIEEFNVVSYLHKHGEEGIRTYLNSLDELGIRQVCKQERFKLDKGITFENAVDYIVEEARRRLKHGSIFLKDNNVATTFDPDTATPVPTTQQNEVLDKDTDDVLQSNNEPEQDLQDDIANTFDRLVSLLEDAPHNAHADWYEMLLDMKQDILNRFN